VESIGANLLTDVRCVKRDGAGDKPFGDFFPAGEIGVRELCAEFSTTLETLPDHMCPGSPFTAVCSAKSHQRADLLEGKKIGKEKMGSGENRS
jgi:hypothetical protein